MVTMTKSFVRRPGTRTGATTGAGAAALLVWQLFAPAVARAQRDTAGASPAIRVDQVGYYAAAPKRAVVAAEGATRFAVVAVSSGDTVFRGALGAARRWDASGEVVRLADFSSLRRPGRYRVVVAGVGESYPFDIGPTVLRGLARAAVKAFYYQRASTALPPRYAGRWARGAAHPDTLVLVHPSAASAARPAGTVVRSPGGWYDAGDYNKYVVNSGISTYTLLLEAEQFPRYAGALATDIPESANGVPDVLDEALWNLRWMLTMQDPSDGGVYHKLTNAEFDPFVAPARATTPRYVVQKSTPAALDLAAVAAHAALVVRRYPRQLPGLADTLTNAALAAWRWARRHPDSLYDQRAMNERFAPAINTGTYGDRRLDDEFLWAAAELWLATKQDGFLVAAAPLARRPATVPSWPDVATLGVYSLVEHRSELPPSFGAAALEQRLLELDSSLVERVRASAYATTMTTQDFVWGSNGVAANQGMALIQGFRLTGDSTYLRAATQAMDYVLGRNAVDYAFVTGFGSRSPRAPHHRLSATDTVDAPIPGLLVGGPNPGQQDHCAGYPSRVPALSYVDAQCAYAANEVAINWNAPLAYLAGALDATYGEPARPAGARPVSRR